MHLKASLMSAFCSSVRSSLAATAFLLAPPDISAGGVVEWWSGWLMGWCYGEHFEWWNGAAGPLWP